MAAVAGSKGRISFSSSTERKRSFQASLAMELLNGSVHTDVAAQHIIERARLREVGVDTNMICNLACSYCYLNDRPESKGRVNAQRWMQHIQPLVESGCKLVAFIGKEPLADTIALDTIHSLRAATPPAAEQFRIGIVTNGTFIDRRAERLQSAKLDYLDVSLDSFPDVNDAMRGEDVFKKVVANLKIYLQTQPMHDFSITSVLHSKSMPRYTEFVDFLFGLGIRTAFGSPVLRFTEADTAAPIATSVKKIVELLDEIQAYLTRLNYRDKECRQVIIDLPYKYSWLFAQQNIVDCAEIYQDQYEAHVWQPDATIPLFVKFNFLPMSYWRAIRVTHDARVIENMDLAAHRLYSQSTRPCDDVSQRWYLGHRDPYHKKFFADYLAQHAGLSPLGEGIHDRDVNMQFEHMATGGVSESVAPI